MLQVKDFEEVFDDTALPFIQQNLLAQQNGEEYLPFHEAIRQVFVLGEMYGTVSTCLAQNIPIPKELWDMPVVQSFVRGDVDDVVVVDDEPPLKDDELIIITRNQLR